MNTDTMQLDQLEVGDRLRSLDFEAVGTVARITQHGFVLDFPCDICQPRGEGVELDLQPNQAFYPFTADSRAFLWV
jgi:hypothetical protein